MELRIVLAMLGGAALGMAALIILIAAGLDLKECYFLAEFWRSLKAGAYDYEDDDEDEDSDEPDEKERRDEHE